VRLSPQPRREFRRPAADGDVERRQPFPRRQPVDVRSAGQEQLRRVASAAVTREPERVIDVAGRRRRGLSRGERRLDPVDEPERRGLPQRDARASLDQSPRRVPLPEDAGVRQRRTAADR
jgi:hypothetical protein